MTYIHHQQDKHKYAACLAWWHNNDSTQTQAHSAPSRPNHSSSTLSLSSTICCGWGATFTTKHLSVLAQRNKQAVLAREEGQNVIYPLKCFWCLYLVQCHTRRRSACSDRTCTRTTPTTSTACKQNCARDQCPPMHCRPKAAANMPSSLHTPRWPKQAGRAQLSSICHHEPSFFWL